MRRLRPPAWALNDWPTFLRWERDHRPKDWYKRP